MCLVERPIRDMKCARCGAKDSALIGSYFNTDMICLDACQPKEKAHPKYEEARAAELKAVQAGNYNFKGIGKPSDL